MIDRNSKNISILIPKYCTTCAFELQRDVSPTDLDNLFMSFASHNDQKHTLYCSIGPRRMSSCESVVFKLQQIQG